MMQAVGSEGEQKPSPRHSKKRRSSARPAKVATIAGGLSSLAEVSEDEDSEDDESSDDGEMEAAGSDEEAKE